MLTEQLLLTLTNSKATLHTYVHLHYISTRVQTELAFGTI